jgi:hypothetical protein
MAVLCSDEIALTFLTLALGATFFAGTLTERVVVDLVLVVFFTVPPENSKYLNHQELMKYLILCI